MTTTAFKVPFVALGQATQEVKKELMAAVEEVLDSGMYVLGPEGSELEIEFAKLCDAKFAAGIATGTCVLHLVLRQFGLGEGDEVITVPNSFIATASTIALVGAQPVFIDIQSDLNMDPGLIEEAITPRTKAIVPVHLTGRPAKMQQILEIAERHNLFVLEDAAQAIGTKLDGKSVGSWGDAACFSLHPLKNIHVFGDGGMMTTRDEDWAERLRLLAAHGMSPRYFHKVVGINSRLDSIQAAAVNVKLSRLEQWTAQRQAHAGRYAQLFADVGLQEVLTLPTESEGCRHVWNQYTIRVPETRRDALRAYLTGKGVGSEVYYPCPLHLQECFQEMGFGAGSLPESERAAQEVLSLPIFPGLTVDEQQVVVGRIAEFYGARQANAA